MDNTGSFSRYDVYTTVGSIYCYAGTNVLRNRMNIRNNELLKNFESDFYSVRQAELIKSPIQGRFSASHLCKIHQYLFGDIYPFAGHFRREDILKGKTRFLSYTEVPEKTKRTLKLLWDENLLQNLQYERYIERAAYYMAELNYIHPFREGNGRSIREFMRCLFLYAGYQVNWNNVSREYLLSIMEQSIYDYKYLMELLRKCLSTQADR